MTEKTITRCAWAHSHTDYYNYHDHEWGVPIHDDRKHFEHLILDGAQAGLSWLTILRRREGYRKAFAGFDPVKVAAYTKKDINRLLKDTGIIRNRMKIESAVQNARAFLRIQEEFGSFDQYIWQFVGHKTKVNRFAGSQKLPAKTAESTAMSANLRKRGFNFVGPTICYAYMQASGMVNDHATNCFRHKELVRGQKKIPTSPKETLCLQNGRTKKSGK
ncbi:MAG: DNA-3-methyladenine glycosylase I [Candidatus Omnitrophota bacterium]